MPPNAQYLVDRYYPYGSTATGYYPIHHGVEFVNPIGVPVLAVANGKVVVAGDDMPLSEDLLRLFNCKCEDEQYVPPIYGPKPGFYGKLVIIELARVYHEKPVFCLYGHLSKILVKPGQHIEREEVLGEIGMSGVALGPHLHFEVRVGENSYWETRDPELWLAPLPEHGIIAGRFVDAQGRHLAEKLITFRRAAQPNEFWQETWTYPRREVNPDDDWGENFVMGDVPIGSYVVHGHIGERSYGAEIEVEEGKTTFVELIARGE